MVLLCFAVSSMCYSTEHFPTELTAFSRSLALVLLRTWNAQRQCKKMKLISPVGVLLLAVVAVNFARRAAGSGMVEVFGWKQMDFYNRGERAGVVGKPARAGAIVFPDQLQHVRNRRAPEVITSRDQPPQSVNTRWRDTTEQPVSDSYIPYNNVPMGATHHNGRLFITMPRRRTGIPSTLNYIDMRRDGTNKSPKLSAYPNFETNYLNPNFVPNTNAIVSVYRTTVDACKRLWFIDTGMLEYPNNRTQLQRPSIWIMDLSNDRVLHRFEIPQSVADTGRGLASITIDVKPQQCGDAFAYIPDLVYNQLYVYSLRSDRIWSFSHNYFNFDPLAGDLHIGGQTFRWDDGIFSITLGPYGADGYRNVFFHPMASNNEFAVNSRVLQNEDNAARSDHGMDFSVLGSRGVDHQSTMHEYDARSGNIFYAEIQRNGVGCWNTNRPFSAENHGAVAQDPQRMIYPSDLTIDDEGTIWVMTNSMPIFIYSNLDPSVVNFRVWKQNVFRAAENTVCAP